MTHDDNTCGSYGKIAGRIGLTDGGSELNSMPSNCIHPLVGNAQLLWVKHTAEVLVRPKLLKRRVL